MRQILEKVGRTNRMTSGATADGQYWRQVPKVNILSRDNSQSSNSQFIRILLFILLLAAVFAIFTQNRVIGAAEENIENGQSEFQFVERQLSSAESEVDPIKAQIQSLKNQRKSAGAEFRLVTADLIDWHEALGALLGIQAAGVIFSSVSTSAGGEVILEGRAADSGTISQLPAEFNAVSDILDFQGIQWDTGFVPPTFTASFKVR